MIVISMMLCYSALGGWKKSQAYLGNVLSALPTDNIPVCHAELEESEHQTPSKIQISFIVQSTVSVKIPMRFRGSWDLPSSGL